jgi:hypothetical protein
LRSLEFIGEDNVTYESDYPHSDSLWPKAPERLWESIKHLTSAQIDKITNGNAMRFFNFDPFQHYKRNDLSVGTLRALAKVNNVDTTPRSFGGAAPSPAGESERPITSGDIMKMFTDQAEAV